jgi:hypothetical protein
MKNRLPFLLLILVVVVVGAVSLTVWFRIFNNAAVDDATRRTMLLELSKLLAQLVLIAVLGGMVTALYNWYSREQEDRRHAYEKEQEQRRLQIDEDNDLRRELLTSLIEVRAQVEKARREFRLLPAREKKAGYRTAIEALLAARLKLSQVWHDTETWKGLYGEQSRSIHQGLTGMKIFLDGLIDEYEARNAAIQEAGKETFPQVIMDLTCFGDFVKEDGGPDYTQVFLDQNYRSVARIIRQSILDSSK